MKEYIKLKIDSMRGKPFAEQKRLLVDLYNELEDRGMTHSEVFMMVNLVIGENINTLTRKARGDED